MHTHIERIYKRGKRGKGQTCRTLIRLDADGVPELVVVPDATGSVMAVSMVYALKDPFNFTRVWLDTPCVRTGDTWTGKMPVTNVNEYVFGYANVAYDTQIVLSTHFNAAIPAEIGDRTNAMYVRGEVPVGETRVGILEALPGDGDTAVTYAVSHTTYDGAMFNIQNGNELHLTDAPDHH